MVVNQRSNTRLSLMAVIGCFFMISCQTVSEKQATLIQENGRFVKQRCAECIQKVESNPSYDILLSHTTLNLGRAEPTLAQLADDNLPTDQEIEAIIALHNETAACRALAVDYLMTTNPSMGPGLVQSYQALDLITADLILRRTTWGESNIRRLAVKNVLGVKWQEITQQQAKGLKTPPDAESAQKQKATEALAQWADQQQVLAQNKEISNAIHSSAMTSCWWNGRSMQCNSH